MMDHDIEVNARGDTVWVNSGVDGSCIGRFSKRFGMDVHRSVTEQMQSKGECLHCTHAPAGQAEWDLFCTLIREHYGIVVPHHYITF